MDLKRWKIFDKLDPMFAADIKRVYLMGITSRQEVFKEHSKFLEFISNDSFILNELKLWQMLYGVTTGSRQNFTFTRGMFVFKSTL